MLVRKSKFLRSQQVDDTEQSADKVPKTSRNAQGVDETDRGRVQAGRDEDANDEPQSSAVSAILPVLWAAVIGASLLITFAPERRALWLNPELLQWGSGIIGGVAVCLLVLSLFRRERLAWFLPIAAALWFVQPRVLLAITVVTVGEVGLGAAIFTRLFGADGPRLLSSGRKDTERSLGASSAPLFPSYLIGLATFSAVTFVVMHLPFNYPVVYWAATLTVAALVFERTKGVALAAFAASPGWKCTWVERILLCHLCSTIFFPIIGAYGGDDLAKHLFVPSVVLRLGYYPFSPTYSYALDAAAMPVGGTTVNFLLGGETAVRFVHWILFYGAIGFFAREMGRMFSRRIAGIAALSVVTTPYLLLAVTNAFVESYSIAAASVLTTAMIALLRGGNGVRGEGQEVRSEDPLIAKRIRLFFLFGGIAVVGKFQAIFLITAYSAVLYSVLLARAAQSPGRARAAGVLLRRIAIECLWCVVPVGAVLLHNYVISGNPVYPFLNSIFQSPFFPPMNFVDTRWMMPFSFRVPYELTFEGSKHLENIDPSFGLNLFVLSLLAILPFATLRGRSSAHSTVSETDGRAPTRFDYGVLLVAYTTFFVLMFFGTGLYIRYFATGTFLLSLLFAILAESVLRGTLGSMLLKTVAWGALGAVLATNTLAQLTLGNAVWPHPLKILLTGERASSSLAHGAALQGLFDQAAKRFGPNARCFIGDLSDFYYAKCDAESNTWYHPRLWDALQHTTGGDDAFRLLTEQSHFDYFVLPDEVRISPALNKPEFRGKLALEFKVLDYGVYTVKPPTP